MDAAAIARLLAPFLIDATLSPAQLDQISAYTDLLLRWNAHINLTAVRSPEEIIARHFGESLFAARQLCPPVDQKLGTGNSKLVFDVGSGAGFPGLPFRIWEPSLQLTLIESNHKKVVFLREVIRSLGLTQVEVFAGRAQDFHPAAPAGIVTLRAVERFETILPIASSLLAPAGRLALLIGSSQVPATKRLLPAFHWDSPITVPLSSARVLLVGPR